MIVPIWFALTLGCDVTDPGEAATRRLSPTQYNNSIRELLGFEDDAWPEDEEDEETIWPWQLPAEVEVAGFDGMAEGQIASSYLVEQYQQAAAQYATAALEAPYFWACEDYTALDDEDAAACGQASVERLAYRAYRRPLDADERSRLQDFFQSSVSAWGLEDGIRLTLQGVLMTPQFLYRLESGASGARPTRLDDYEIANRLSYFLWDSMPDAELFEAAASGQLSKRSQVEAQARRMLADARARDAVVRFHSQWLGLEDVHAANADMDTYMPTYIPDYEDQVDLDDPLYHEDAEEIWSSYLIGVRAAMVQEAELFIEKTLFEGGGTLERLLTDNHGYVTEIDTDGGVNRTAEIYGIGDEALTGGGAYITEISDGNFEFVLESRPATFPADQRAGVLTHGAVLAGLAHPVHPAPVLRGVFVLEQLACQPMGQPPEGAESAAPADTLEAEGTNRQRVEASTTAPECAACHDTINPVGFAFEHYDSLGGWRDQDNGEAVDASGALSLVGEGGDFTGAVELAHHLASNAQVHDCYTQHWTRYALGQSSIADETLAPLQQSFLDSGGDVLELLVSITTSDAFRYRSPGGDP